ncbi:ATP-binding protein [Actinocrispum wychmicini]|uniref:ATPase family protein associated with various cellular activities (AAA) n=1 Tax=Actinocrispum wychmicini TaxID=1213861 RepID=A0A4R2JFY2_9PSEU|nr:ATP-binding protein [Actinocrispum wychmicini]TCO55219.1 ATPase family protein associated with various cellular activities (AAA) [Actinocrispum wychmicini]
MRDEGRLRSAPPWQVMADTLLQREALVCRLGEGLLPHDFAGLYIGHEEVDRILAELPGASGPAAERVDALLRQLEPELALARKLFAESLDQGGTVFDRLVRHARLDEVDAQALALMVAVERSPHRMRLVSYFQDNVQLPRLTVASLTRMLGSGRSVSPDAPLLRAELVELGTEGPWATRMCWPAMRVTWAMADDDSADSALPAGTRRLEPVGTGAVEPQMLLVTGADADSRLTAVRDRWPGKALLVCPLPTSAAEWASVVREAGVGDRAVVLELEAPPDRKAADRIDRTTHLSWVLSSPRELALDSLPRRPWREIRLDSGLAESADWAQALGIAPDPSFPLSRDQLRLVTAASAGDPEQVSAGVRRLAGGHLDGLSVRIRPRRTMSDLVLPSDQTAQLRELIARYRRRSTVYREWGYSPLPSTGVVALFSGPSGTGKTLAAEIVAGELGLDVYKVDLSSVVSKYIGETEKNLERIFGAAAAGDLVLFFDEADSLFGKRSEVSDAHDRYANIEVAYLLQRLESYDGLVVMATNLQRNIDDAFLRRISVAIDFEAPDEPQRKQIWRQAFPSGAPVAELDYDFLARQFRITGGIIRNAALGAGFLAAEQDGPVTMERVALALKREFQKLGRLRTESEFDRYFDLVNGDGDAEPAG